MPFLGNDPELRLRRSWDDLAIAPCIRRFASRSVRNDGGGWQTHTPIICGRDTGKDANDRELLCSCPGIDGDTFTKDVRPLTELRDVVFSNQENIEGVSLFKVSPLLQRLSLIHISEPTRLGMISY